MSKNFDVSIIGSGFGGLVAGAILSKNGMKVAIVEQHDKVGGFATHFKRKGFSFEVAVHFLDGQYKKNFRSNVFDYLDIENQVEFVNVPNFFGAHLESGMVEVPANALHARESLCRKFPNDSVGINIFFDSMEKVSDQFADFVRREPAISFKDPFFGILYPDFHDLAQQSIAGYVYSLVKDTDLRWILLANLGFYYHDLNFSAAAYLVNQACYFHGGARYVKGGVQNMSNFLAGKIKEAGGEIYLNHQVEEILIENNSAVGITYRRTRGPDKDILEIKSKYVIANGAVPHIYKDLLKGKFAADPLIYPAEAPVSTSATTLYLGLNKPFHQLTPGSFFNFYRSQKSFDLFGSKNLGRDFSLIDYSVADESFFHSKKFTADIVYLDNENHWGDAFARGLYKEHKQKMIDQCLAWIKKLNPEFERTIEVVELGTPRAVEKFTRNTEGAIYGFNGSLIPFDIYCERLRLNFEPKDENISNLYFASAWSSCHSITGVTIAGYQAARSILVKEGITLKV